MASCASGEGGIRQESPNPKQDFNLGTLSSDRVQQGSAIRDPDLAAIMRAWPALPTATRQAVVSLVRAAPSHAL